MPQIRPAVRADVPRIQELTAEAPGASQWPADKYDSYFAPEAVQTSYLFVADHNHGVNGFVAARSVSDECEIENIVVSRAVQRHGIASELLRHLLFNLSDRIQSVFLEVRESNQPAIRLYEKAGFKVVGRRKSYYRQPPEDALIMRKSFGKLA